MYIVFVNTRTMSVLFAIYHGKQGLPVFTLVSYCSIGLSYPLFISVCPYQLKTVNNKKKFSIPLIDNDFSMSNNFQI